MCEILQDCSDNFDIELLELKAELKDMTTDRNKWMRGFKFLVVKPDSLKQLMFETTEVNISLTKELNEIKHELWERNIGITNLCEK